MNYLSFNVLARPVFLFGLFTVAFLCVGRLVHAWFAPANSYWLLTLMAVLCAVSGVLVKNALQQKGGLPVYVWCCLIYGCLVAYMGLVHAAGLYVAPRDIPINAEGLSAFLGLKMGIYFTCIYLFFPAMLLAQYTLARKLPMQTVIRWCAFAMTLSLGVLLYQQFVDHSLLAFPPWDRGSRYGGLATDPNAFALDAFLLLPLLVIGMTAEKSRRMKCLYGLMLALIIPAEWFTGNRTAATGIFLFIMMIPLIMALSYRHWPLRWRAVAGMIPAVMLVLGIFFAPVVVSTLDETGGTGARLAQTWKKFESGGIERVFTHGEARGGFYNVATGLMAEAPLAGWGPGGFYREYSNIIYQWTGMVQQTFDSALNHSLMIAGDFGIPVALLNLGLILIPMILGMIVFKHLSDVKLRFVVALLVVSNAVFLLMIMTIPPSYFLDVLWIWTAELAWLLVVAEQHGVCFRLSPAGRHRAGLAVIVMILLAFAGSYQTAFGANGYSERQKLSWWDSAYGKNCYPPDRQMRGVPRWCGKDAQMMVRVRKHNIRKKRVVLYVKVSHPDIASEPVTVTYGSKQGATQSIRLNDHNWHKVIIPVSREGTMLIRQRNRARRFVLLSVDVSRTWISDDGRELGVAVARRVPKS